MTKLTPTLTQNGLLAVLLQRQRHKVIQLAQRRAHREQVHAAFWGTLTWPFRVIAARGRVDDSAESWWDPSRATLKSFTKTNCHVSPNPQLQRAPATLDPGCNPSTPSVLLHSCQASDNHHCSAGFPLRPVVRRFNDVSYATETMPFAINRRHALGKGEVNTGTSRGNRSCAQWAPAIISFMICRPLACNGPLPVPGRNHMPLSLSRQ
jgi:hypothetical protein